MINLKSLKNKKVGVLGLEKTGVSVVKAVEQAGGFSICWDDNKEKRDNLDSRFIKFITEIITQYAQLFKSVPRNIERVV